MLAASSGGLVLGWSDVWNTAATPRSVIYTKSWNGTSFAENMPGDARDGGISATSVSIQTLALAVNPAGQPFIAWNQGAGGSPAVYVVGNTFEADRVFYVSSGTAGEIYTTAPGSDSNSGLTPSAPLASIQGLMNEYTLQPGDLILIDPGIYTIPDAFGRSATGVTLVGAPDGGTTLEVGDSSVSASDTTLQDVTITGALPVDAGSGFTLRDSSADGVDIQGGSGALLSDNQIGGLSITGGASGTDVESNTIGGGGLFIGGATAILVRGNTIGGITIGSASDGTISGNDVSGAGTALAVDAPFGGTITGNTLYGSAIGLAYNAAAAVGGNQIFDNVTGVMATVINPASALGFVGSVSPNQIFGNTTGVDLLGQMQGQHIFDNTTGVTGDGTLGGTDFAHPNVIESNAVGVDFAGTIQFNQITGNAIGVEIVVSTGQGGDTADGHLIAHNEFDLNTQSGVDLAGNTDVRIFNNTFYSATGDNIDVEGSSSNVDIENNILWADGGYDIYVANDSQSGFWSDFNDLNAGPGGTLVYWTRPFTDLLDWQDDVAKYDLQSIGTTVINPTGAQPQFLNRGAGDLQVFPIVDSQRGSSPTVGLGDPITDQGLPASSPPNLLSNGSFESGLSGWATNTGALATTSSPAGTPFDGSYFFDAGAVADGSASQTVNLLAAGYTAAELDSGGLYAVFSGRVRTSAKSPPDLGEITIKFLGASGNVISQTTDEAQGASDRWELLGSRLAIPVGTRSIEYLFDAVRLSGSTDDASLDNAVLKLVPEGVAPDVGAFGETAADAAPVVAPRIVLNTPYLYVDAVRNSPLIIQWNTYGNVTDAPLRIDLYQDGPNGPAFLQTIAAGAADTGSYAWTPSNNNIAFDTYGLRIEVSIVGDAAAFNRSAETFTVPENTTTFYVNDSSTAGDMYTTAPGSNRNDGRIASAPKPNPLNLLRTYTLGPTDKLFIDTGVYPLFTPMVLSGTIGVGDGQGFVVTGPTGTGAARSSSRRFPARPRPSLR